MVWVENLTSETDVILLDKFEGTADSLLTTTIISQPDKMNLSYTFPQQPLYYNSNGNGVTCTEDTTGATAIVDYTTENIKPSEYKVYFNTDDITESVVSPTNNMVLYIRTKNDFVTPEHLKLRLYGLGSNQMMFDLLSDDGTVNESSAVNVLDGDNVLKFEFDYITNTVDILMNGSIFKTYTGTYSDTFNLIGFEINRQTGYNISIRQIEVSEIDIEFIYSYTNRTDLLSINPAMTYEGALVSVETEPGNIYVRNDENTLWIPRTRNSYATEGDVPEDVDFEIPIGSEFINLATGDVIVITA